VVVPTIISPETLLQHLDGTGDIHEWLTHVRWTLCQSGDRLVQMLIASGFQGCPCERAELALEVLESHQWITRGGLDPIAGYSGLAFAKAWPSVTIAEKRRCWCWMPGQAGGAGDAA
jgi:hypothetical protein